MAEITRKSVLLECLSIMREEQRICSKGYNCLEPAKGMEEAWEQGRRKITILQEIIQALDSEPVLRAMAGWQKEIMEKGTPRENNSEFCDRCYQRKSADSCNMASVTQIKDLDRCSTIQNSELTAAAGGDPSTMVGMTPRDEIRVVKISDEMKEYVESLNGDILDHEDGTMELR